MDVGRCPNKGNGLVLIMYNPNDKEGETPMESAKREAFEEAGITRDYPYIELESMSSLPVEDVVGASFGEKTYMY